MSNKIVLCVTKISNFCKDAGGQITIMLAVLMIPLTVFVGGSLDWSQQITTKAKMQSTVDSAILAVARQLTTKKKLTQAEMDSIAKTVFDTNISVAANVKMANFKITLKDDLLRITQQAEVSTSFLKIIDIPTLGVNVVSEVLVKFEGVDIALAVDLSGSMGGNKIQHLRNATVSLLEELTASNLTEMRVAFVPWTRGVNLKGYYYKVTKPAAQNARRPQARERNTSQAKMFLKLKTPLRLETSLRLETAAIVTMATTIVATITMAIVMTAIVIEVITIVVTIMLATITVAIVTEVTIIVATAT